MPSFTAVTNGATVQAQDIDQLVNALNGTSGQGVPIAITGPNDSVNFALAVKNNEVTNSRALQVLRANNAVLIQADANGVVVSPDGVAATAQVVNLSLAQTLTNKILTSPHFTSPVVDSGGLTITAGGLTVSAGNTLLPAQFNHTGTLFGIFNHAAGTQPTVTGSKGANAALTSLLTGLASLGIVIDSSS